MTSLLNEVDIAYQCIRNGGVILYPTDTIWGLGCDATNAEAIQRIYAIKKRDNDKSCIILVPTMKELLKYVAAPPINIEDIYAHFTEPTTVIFDNAINLPGELVKKDGSIAIRIPKDDFCIQLLKKLQRPVVSTSANISGSPSPASFADITEDILNAADHIVNWKRTDTSPKQPSRIVKINDNGHFSYIR